MDTTGTLALPEAASTQIERKCSTLEFAVPSRPRMVSAIRSRVRKFAHHMPFTEDELDDIGVAVGEAGTNAVKYGHGLLGPSTVKVELSRSADALRIRILDTGPGFDPSKVCPPGIGDLRECGRGLMCMFALMDEVRFIPLDPGTCVEMVKRVGNWIFGIDY